MARERAPAIAPVPSERTVIKTIRTVPTPAVICQRVLTVPTPDVVVAVVPVIGP